jgi:hypothetical protein
MTKLAKAILSLNMALIAFSVSAFDTSTILKSEFDRTMFKRSIDRDRSECKFAPEKMFSVLENKISEKIQIPISGDINYMGQYTGPYKYDVKVKNGHAYLSTKIFIRNVRKKSIRHNEAQLEQMKKKIKWAENYWNRYIPAELPMSFKFEIVESKKDAYFRPALITRYTRGPYYTGWSTKFNTIVVAHEIGHMFGLDDEYENNMAGGNTTFCDVSSLMCSNAIGAVIPAYSYYIILNRIGCFASKN